MKKNMGNLDRIVRTFVVAPAAVALALWLGVGSVAGLILLVVAAIMVATSGIGFCPLYAPLGLSTCARDAGGDSRRAHA